MPNPAQPRRDFDESSLHELAASIREYGVIEPVLVRRDGETYVLVAGERRVRAARIAGMRTVPAILREDPDRDMLSLALIENIQREDLSPVEEAEAYRKLMDELGLTQEGVAERVGKSRAAVANALRLLQLRPEIRADISTGKITAGHARAILSVDSGDEQIALWKAIKAGNLTVRHAEAEARERTKRAPRTSIRRRVAVDPNVADLEERLRQRLGTQVKIHLAGKGGRVEVNFFNHADLNRLVELMGVADDGGF
jgi:ParB family chromosome partitioning protein